MLGDSTYPMKPWILKTYRGTSGITPEQDSFKVYLSRARVVVERAFGKLKARWRCLNKKIGVNVNFVPSVIVACYTLRNIIEHVDHSYNDIWNRELNEHTHSISQPLCEPTNDSVVEDRGDQNQRAETKKIRDA